MISVIYSLIFALVMTFNQTKEYTFIALGDSYTIGESVEEYERWPNQTANLLKKEGISFSKPEIIARTGWTTSELIQNLRQAKTKEKYDFVSLLIGVNNQYRGLSLEDYKKEFEFLLEKAIKLAGNQAQRVIVISIPDYGATPFGREKDSEKIQTEIDQFNKINYSSAKSMKVNYVEVTKDSRLALTNPGMTASDNLHPSGEMYQQWAIKVSSVIRSVLMRR